jgi:hypothetical protein
MHLNAVKGETPVGLRRSIPSNRLDFLPDVQKIRPVGAPKPGNPCRPFS